MRLRKRRIPNAWHHRVRRWTLQIAAGVLMGTVLVVLALRWTPVPVSSFMVQHLLGESHAPLRYQWVPIRDIAPPAPAAAVAAEDQRFYQHYGFDFPALRAAWRHNQAGGPVRGGSTISQQVAKNLFLWPGRSLLRKGIEAYFTVLIEILWPKQRILEVYLNIAQFGDGIYGIGAASNAFFGKTPATLTPAEAALLAAVLPNPVRLQADRPSAYVLQRRDWIQGQVWQLQTHGYLP